jgi:hypothetical protein
VKHTFISLLTRFISLILVLSSFKSQVQAEIVTVKDGLWNDASTWSGTEVPQSFADITIRHNLTISEDILKSSGILTLSPGKSITIGAGKVLSFEGSSSFKAACTAALRCLVTSTPLGNGRITFAGREFQAAYVDFTNLGNNSDFALDLIEKSSGFYLGRSNLFNLTNSRFVRSGGLRLGSLSNGGLNTNLTINLRSNKFLESLNTQSLSVSFTSGKSAGFSREIASNVFDKEVNFFPPKDISVIDNVFLGDIYFLATDPTNITSQFRGNFIRRLANRSAPVLLPGDSLENYWYYDNVSLINPHFVQANSYISSSISGNIFEFNGNDGSGDSILFQTPTTPLTHQISFNIVLPNNNNQSSGTPFTALGNNQVSIIAEHNTYFTGFQSAVIGENFSGYRNMLKSFRSNLAWDGNTNNSGRGSILGGSTNTTPPVIDVVLASNVTHNGGFNIGTPYRFLTFSGGASPGNSDVYDNPDFFDPTRNLISWDRSTGGIGSKESAFSKLAASNDSPNNREIYSPQVVIEYVRQGFYPRNVRFQGTAHDERVIGAVQDNRGEVILPTPLPVPSEIPTIASPSPSPTPTPGLVGAAATPTATPCLPASALPPGVPPCTRILPPIKPPLTGSQTRELIRLCERKSTARVLFTYNQITETCTSKRVRTYQRECRKRNTRVRSCSFKAKVRKCSCRRLTS